MTAEDRLIEIAEAAARMAHEQGLLSGPTRAAVDADLSVGWPRMEILMRDPKDIGNPMRFATVSMRSFDRRPGTHMIELLHRTETKR